MGQEKSLPLIKAFIGDTQMKRTEVQLSIEIRDRHRLADHSIFLSCLTNIFTKEKDMLRAKNGEKENL